LQLKVHHQFQLISTELMALMEKSLKTLIRSYVKYARTHNYDAISNLYKLPTVLKGVDGNYLCLHEQEQLNNYIKDKFSSPAKDSGKKIALEYIGCIGEHFSLLKEKRSVKNITKAIQSEIIIKEIAGRFWIIGESRVN